MEIMEILPRPRRREVAPLPASVSRKLSPVERQRIMRGARRGDYDALAKAEATIRSKKEYRLLWDAIFVFEIAVKKPVRKVIDAIPEQDNPEMAKRINRAWRFYSKLRDELAPYENLHKLPRPDDDKRALAEALRKFVPLKAEGD